MPRKRNISLGSGLDRYGNSLKKQKSAKSGKVHTPQQLSSKKRSRSSSPRKQSPPLRKQKAATPSAAVPAPKFAKPFAAEHEVDIELPFQSREPVKDGEADKMAEDINERIQEKEELSCIISDKWAKDIKDKRPGFRNPDVLCYRHSLFQALMHIPKFINWLVEFHKVEDCCSENAATCVACALRDLASLYWYGKTNGERKNISETLSYLNKILRKRGWRTDTANEQGDPDEQFTKMMHFIQQDMGKHQAPQFDAIQSTILASSITCPECGHTTQPNISEISNFALGLSPHLSGKKMALFMKEYMEDSIEGYRCDGCKKLVNVVRKTKILSPADIVTVQIKRADFGFYTNTKIALSEKLNLTRYSAGPSKQLQYELMATVCYKGNTSYGHYIAHCLGPKGDWVTFDDDSKSRTDIHEALGYSRRGTFDPVLLYYKRVYGKVNFAAVEMPKVTPRVTPATLPPKED